MTKLAREYGEGVYDGKDLQMAVLGGLATNIDLLGSFPEIFIPGAETRAIQITVGENDVTVSTGLTFNYVLKAGGVYAFGLMNNSSINFDVVTGSSSVQILEF